MCWTHNWLRLEGFSSLFHHGLYFCLPLKIGTHILHLSCHSESMFFCLINLWHEHANQRGITKAPSFSSKSTLRWGTCKTSKQPKQWRNPKHQQKVVKFSQTISLMFIVDIKHRFHLIISNNNRDIRRGSVKYRTELFCKGRNLASNKCLYQMA